MQVTCPTVQMTLMFSSKKVSKSVLYALQLDALSAVDADRRFRKASGRSSPEAAFPEYSLNLATAHGGGGGSAIVGG